MLSAIAPFADVQSTLAVADRTEIRARSTDNDAASPHLDVSTTPSARLAIGDRTTELSIGYLPTFTLHDVQSDAASPELFHAAFIGLTTRVDRRVRLSLSEDAGYGDRNFSYLAAAPSSGAAPPGQAAPTPTQALPSLDTIRFGSTRTGFVAQVQPTRRLALASSLAYGVSGGIDDASRAVVPLQYGPRADVSAAYALTRLDRATLAVAATHTDFSATRCSLDPAAPTCTPEVELLDASVGWGRRLARDADLALTAGTSVVRSRNQPNDAFSVRALPLASATYTDLYRSGEDHGLARLDLRLSPVIDLRTGVADERAQATGTFAWTRRRTTARVTASFAQSVLAEEAAALTLVIGDVEALYALNRRFDISAGLRAAWQDQAPLGPLFTRLAFVAVAFHESRLRL